MKTITAIILAALSVQCFAADVEWTRFKGTVKSVNLKAPSVSIQNSEGDLFMVPVDYQVKIVDRKNVLRQLKDLEIDEKITLLKVISEKPHEETDGLVPYQGMDPVAGEQETIKKKK